MSTHLIYYYRDFMEKDFPFKLDFRTETSLNLDFHGHEHVQICYLMRGTCYHFTDNQKYLMSKGDMLAIPPFVPHRFEAVTYIEQHDAGNLQLEEVAQRAAMSPTYFSYMFKVLKGQSFVQYVNDVRIRKAIDLLQLTEIYWLMVNLFWR